MAPDEEAPPATGTGRPSRPDAEGSVQLAATAGRALRGSGEAQCAEVRCILALSRALLAHGLPVHRVEESVQRLASAFGRTATVMGLPTTLSISLSGPDSLAFHLIRGPTSSFDLGRLSVLHRLVGRIERGDVDAHGALDQLALVTHTQRRHQVVRELVCAALVGGAGAQLFGGTPVDSVAASALAAAVAGISHAAAGSEHRARVVPVMAAACVTLACAALAHAAVLAHPLIVTLSALLVVLPGLTFTLAAVELGTGHMVCGSARLVSAIMTFIQLGFGVLLGVRLGAIDALTPVAPLTPSLTVELCSAAALGLGFCGLLAVHRGDAPWTALVCSFAWGANRLLGAWQGPEIAILLAVIGVGVISNLFASRLDRPSSVLLVPGIAMLVPGSLGLLSISSALLHDSRQAWLTLVHLLAITMALSTGVLVSAALLPPRTHH